MSARSGEGIGVRRPLIEGWFTMDEEPHLLGQRCDDCATIVFPPRATYCPNPRCSGETLTSVELSRVGRVWSYTGAEYQPPEPYIAPSDPFVPFAIAAVELSAEKVIVLGQVASGFGVESLHVGSPVELVVESAETHSGDDLVIWKWRPTSDGAS